MSAQQPEALRLADVLETHYDIYVDPVEAASELRRLHIEVGQYKAARIGYASEFPVNAEGLPDVENIHRNIRNMKFMRDELLEFAQEWLERQGTDENYMTAKARAAIAKAEGGKK